MRLLLGGDGPRCGAITHPAFVAGYDTVACGAADEIRPAEGETAIRVEPGSPFSFASWVIGTHEEFVSDGPVPLRGRQYFLAPSDEEVLRRARDIYRAL
jgi:hypothetical protein